MPVKRVLLADNVKRDPLIEDILRKAKRFDVPVDNAPRQAARPLSERGSHQGVMAETKPFSYVNVTTVLEAAEKSAAEHEGRALVVMLDHITDAGNLGAVARSAESVGAAGIVIPNKRGGARARRPRTSTAGAISHPPVTQVSNLWGRPWTWFKENGFWVAGASEHAEGLVCGSRPEGQDRGSSWATEGEGLSRIVQDNCDFPVRSFPRRERCRP